MSGLSLLMHFSPTIVGIRRYTEISYHAQGIPYPEHVHFCVHFIFHTTSSSVRYGKSAEMYSPKISFPKAHAIYYVPEREITYIIFIFCGATQVGNNIGNYNICEPSLVSLV